MTLSDTENQYSVQPQSAEPVVARPIYQQMSSLSGAPVAVARSASRNFSHATKRDDFILGEYDNLALLFSCCGACILIPITAGVLFGIYADYTELEWQAGFCTQATEEKMYVRRFHEDAESSHKYYYKARAFFNTRIYNVTDPANIMDDTPYYEAGGCIGTGTESWATSAGYMREDNGDPAYPYQVYEREGIRRPPSWLCVMYDLHSDRWKDMRATQQLPASYYFNGTQPCQWLAPSDVDYGDTAYVARFTSKSFEVTKDTTHYQACFAFFIIGFICLGAPIIRFFLRYVYWEETKQEFDRLRAAGEEGTGIGGGGACDEVSAVPRVQMAMVDAEPTTASVVRQDTEYAGIGSDASI